ncbi:hypothetical protein AD940_01095 [Gluconobacter thailandicus]|uniref:hypothetical protein n=1 Tax=Gluconobacter thailandicus TaxID=257438 RepID=UPI0007778E84|nr:hypothetical protein [Gluconobacter thailandicus]KXV35900.1 hypothetical protein AD940_01095 [Gluconobacter thailandicus]
MAFNPEIISAAKVQILAAETCDEIQKIKGEVLDALQDQLDGLNEQLAVVKPILELLENPAAELPKIISWIEKFITHFLKPYVKPIETAVQDMAAMAKAISDLESALVQAASKIENCTLDLKKSPFS